MFNSTKQKIKMTKTALLSQIITLFVALVAFLIVQLAVGKENLGFAPIWMLFIVYFLGTFAFALPVGLIKKSALAIVAGGISGVFGLEILLFCVADIRFWYVWIVIGLVLLILVFVLTFFLKADALTVEFDNQPDSGRKTYAERKAEKLNAPEKEEKPLPEVKSFKDENSKEI